MSTDYRVLEDLPFKSLFDGRLAKYGIRERERADDSSEYRCLEGRDGYLIVYDEEGQASFRRTWNCGMPIDVIEAIEQEFDVSLISEHEPEYWGFETKEEWDASWQAMAKEGEEQFYEQVVKYVRGDPNHGIESNTIGMMHAEIAKEVVTEKPALFAEDLRDVLMAEVDRIYDERHSTKVTRRDSNRDLMQLLTTSWKRLPQA